MVTGPDPADRGSSPPDVAADGHPAPSLRALDAELAATIDGLRRARAEIALVLRRTDPT